jgi:hypothetical protein
MMHKKTFARTKLSDCEEITYCRETMMLKDSIFSDGPGYFQSVAQEGVELESSDSDS